PEFTQIDIETSFLSENEIMSITEDMIKSLFKEILNVDLGEFPRMPFSEAMEKYGSDKPDLRIPLEMVEIKDLMKDVEFKVFSGPANDPKGRVTAMNVPKGGDIARRTIDAYTKFV